eukprot:2513896-Prymnesium_polylepis.1
MVPGPCVHGVKPSRQRFTYRTAVQVPCVCVSSRHHQMHLLQAAACCVYYVADPSRVPTRQLAPRTVGALMTSSTSAYKEGDSMKLLNFLYRLSPEKSNRLHQIACQFLKGDF